LYLSHNIAITKHIAIELTPFIVERSQQHTWRVVLHVRQLRHNKHFRVILSLQQYLRALMWKVNSTWCDGFFTWDNHALMPRQTLFWTILLMEQYLPSLM
jgi:hypothetical protein